jgi:acyl-coenzyme A synthetase/AMP-(fatty) acid ligase
MIAERIFEWAQRTPEKTAVIYNERPWSYRAFAEQIGIARGYFLRRGHAGPGYAVLAIQDLLEFWVLSLALRSLGLTTAAVASAAKLSELELPDIRCVITIPRESWPDLESACKTRDVPLISVSLEKAPLPYLPLHETPHEPGGHILFTSGTTGQHKMVLNTAAIDATILKQKTEVIGINQDTVFSVFDFAAWTGPGYKWASAPWMVGGTTVIDQGREPYRPLLNPRLTHAVNIPVGVDRILAAPENAFPRNEAMRFTVSGGALTRRQIEQAKARITPRLFGMISSTEVGTIAFTPLETDEDRRWHRLLPQRVVEVVSDSGHPVPVGEIGRVRVSTKDGPTGYLGDEAATKVYFKDGYFYPGDLAVARSDGRIALQGRFTDVINMRGAKIFPGPIEDRLCESLGVSGACLFSMQNESGEEELYVAIETPTTIDTERMRSAVDDELNEYSTVHVRCVPSLPRNAMGKVSRQAVRALVTASPLPFSRQRPAAS